MGDRAVFVQAPRELEVALSLAGRLSGDDAEAEAAICVRLARSALAAADARGCLQYATAALGHDALPEAFALRGSALLALGQPSAAMDAFREGLRRHPADAELRAGFDRSLATSRAQWRAYKAARDMTDAGHSEPERSTRPGVDAKQCVHARHAPCRSRSLASARAACLPAPARYSSSETSCSKKYQHTS